MVQWRKLFSFDGQDRRHFHDEIAGLLPTSRDRHPPSPIPSREVTKVALRLKHQLEVVIPCELEEWKITKAHSNVITPKVVKTAKSAGGEEYKACVVYCLLVVNKWFKRQALAELWDSDLHEVRAVAAEVIAKQIIEDEEDIQYLLEEVLVKRYSVLIDGKDSMPANAIERAVDLHAVRVIGSSGYQKCINYLWRGWLIQDDDDPSRFIDYENKTNTNYWSHFDPDRMRVPAYQNTLQIFISLTYLALYTVAINTVNPTGDVDVIEALLYFFTLGFILDEISKFWKVGRYYLSFWNVFNSTLYALLTISFVTRMIALSHDYNSDTRLRYNALSYNFLAFSAPMFWLRLMLYLDSFKFFGAMLVVLKVMMRESIIFFALLLVVLIGFLQAFIGMDQVDNNLTATGFIIKMMLAAILQSPEFDEWDNFAPPFGLILYYLFTFIVMVVLLNVLIALYNSAYEDITGNSDDEYMALVAQKTMQFVRAPDENVFIAPFNLIELFLLIIPFEWWMDTYRYERLNNYVMGVIYSPLLLITAAIETKEAHKVKRNRKRGEEDEDTIEEWEQLAVECDFEGEGWTKKVEDTKPDIETDAAIVEIRELKERIKELKQIVEGIKANGS
ncbi:receptor-activated Ca2+-permeable cation channel [Patellaria atrata CBS 101060]|uniref:Receptor-activated Ca2+-permeable cation channel n=1 Tax=Patellaria atrata CBS 101060 TaxID=1346257 RepID=A0A9P4VR61_9PEZI|nr:receptor-activated Ca2+-permeable cation channel [Patellaria atrata CBS 101060]